VRTLVTGGAGYVGGTVAALLAVQGHEPTILDNLCHARRKMVPEGIEYIEGNLCDRDLIEKLFRSAKAEGRPFEAVLHFAALIEAGESMKRPEIYFRNNTASTMALLEAMIAEGPRCIVFSSTAAVYGEPESVPIEECARLKPTNVYGESKLMVETMLDWFHRIYDLRSVSLRYFNVAGAPERVQGITRGEDHEPESHLIPLILDVALGRRQSIRIYGDDYPTPDGTCVRDYIHVTDLARAHMLALEGCVPGEHRVYNLGSGAGFSNLEVLSACREVTGRDIPSEFAPRRAGDPAVLVASSDRIHADLGWRATRGLTAMVADAWQFILERSAPGLPARRGEP